MVLHFSVAAGGHGESPMYGGTSCFELTESMRHTIFMRIDYHYPDQPKELVNGL